MTRRRQHGVAVVLAMGVVSLAALAAAAMLVSQSTWTRYAELNAGHVQARVLAQAGVDWTRALLADDRRLGNVDHLGEPWALRLPPVPVDDGELAGHIEDQQGAFNLNNLARTGATSPAHLAPFRRLLGILALPEALAPGLAAWLEAARRPLADAAELATVPGFDASVRSRLRPFVTALPRATALNVNTAPPEVLAAVVRGLDLDQARALGAQRERAYFRNLADFLAQLPPGAEVEGTDIAISSQYFLASVRVNIGDAQARGTALLARDAPGWPAVVWRKFP
jgi:general secretion pathway protein K